MALGSYQKISRVLAGRPFGDGANGAYSSSTIPTMDKTSCSGTSGNKTLSVSSGSGFSNGDLVFIHQSRGTGVGQWEVNRVTSGGGTTTLTLQENKQYTYTDSGASQAQVIKIPRYTNVTQSGTWTVPAWDGNTGGILVFAANGTVSIGGTITASAKGYTAGDGVGVGAKIAGKQGEGSAGAGDTTSTSANGSGGGGGGVSSNQGAGGGGGGHASSGSSGESNSATGGTGGSAVGNAELTLINFGGGGGSGATGNDGSSQTAAGGVGGGIVAIFGKVITVTGAVASAGSNGGESPYLGAGSGGGAGGSFLGVCQNATLGSSKVTAAAGAGATTSNPDGGNGSVGRVALHYSGSYTGTTSPTLSATNDTSLYESNAGILGLML